VNSEQPEPYKAFKTYKKEHTRRKRLLTAANAESAAEGGNSDDTDWRDLDGE
jgi:hypothetical protein